METTNFDEREVINLVLKGQKDEYRHLVRTYQGRIYGMVRRQTKDAEIARDIAQDVFMRAYRALPSFRFESTFSTWLTRIALNATNSYFKSRQYNQMRKTEDIAPHAEVIKAQDCDSGSHQIGKLQSAIQQLKPIYRDVITLCGVEGKSYDEAARILQIPIGTVRSRLNKARLEIKAALA